MKRFLINIAIIAGLVASASAIAVPAAKNLQISPAGLSAKAGIQRFELAPTNIIILNASEDLIHFSVPNSDIDFPLYPGEYNYIADYTRAHYLTINIEDAYHNIFWSQTVCPRAVVVVGLDGVGVLSNHCG